MPTDRLTLIDEDRLTEVDAVVDGGDVFLTPDELEKATGWVLKPEGLCRGEVCVPLSLTQGVSSDRGIELGRFAQAVGKLMVVDADAGMVAIGPGARARAQDLQSLDAPTFRSTTVGGAEFELADLRGRKKLMVAFSSWCGCRHDLPAWQALHAELEPHGFSVLGVAIDEEPTDVQPWVDEAAATFPVVIDRDHTIAERYSIVNVPTVVWIDEDDQIVRPNDVAFGSDMFADFHHIDSSPHLEAVRRWVLEGEVDLDQDTVRSSQRLPTDDEQLARLHWRIGVELHRRGAADAASRHFARGGELSPGDFTIRRGTMPLQGIDPFLSEEFIALYTEWQDAGGHYYGLAEATHRRDAP